MCRACPHWQLSRKQREYARWGDCYRVLTKLNPALEQCENDMGHPLRVPFDPHDVQYYKLCHNFKGEYLKAMRHLPPGVRVRKVGSKYYLQTHEQFSCGGGEFE